MHVVRTLTAPVAPGAVFDLVGDLSAYPLWMPLVHSVVPDGTVADPTEAAWTVELRAAVGPFSRSKRLRMVRTEHVDDVLAVFERRELDGRDHAAWILRAAIEPQPGVDIATLLTMTLTYDGSLFAEGAMERVLDDQVRRGSSRLLALLTST